MLIYKTISYGPVFNTQSEHCPGCVYKGSMQSREVEFEIVDVYLCSDMVIIYFSHEDYLTTPLADLLKNPHPLRIDTHFLITGGESLSMYDRLLLDYCHTRSLVSKHFLADWCEQEGDPRAKSWRLRAWLHQMIEQVKNNEAGYIHASIPETDLRICLEKGRQDIKMSLHSLTEEVLPPVVLNTWLNDEPWYLAECAYERFDELNLV